VVSDCGMTLCILLRSCFFFSSRRRHTRFSRDWSSDVCSSDLGIISSIRTPSNQRRFEITELDRLKRRQDEQSGRIEVIYARVSRSEERRVGKECRSRWSEYQ